MKSKKKWIISAVLFSLFLVWLNRASKFRPAKNFHVVDSGKFYRSAQLTGEEFKETVEQHGIKTVINLRGAQKGVWWYDDEKAALDELGVRFESIPFATEHVPMPDRLKTFLKVLDTAERPILVHCRSGADRTGMATAIYAIEHMGKTKEEAREFLSFKYLHVSAFQPSKLAFLEIYEGKAWANTQYDHCDDRVKAYAHKGVCPTTESSVSSKQ